MAIWTKGFSAEMKTHVPVSCRDLTYIAQVDDLPEWSLEDLAKAVKAAAADHAAQKLGKRSILGDYYTIVGCIAGGEAGVDMADLLSEHLGVMSNGAQGDFANRRDKKVQQDLVRDKGMRAVRQACGERFEDVVEFLKSESFPVVLKPTDSAGSDGVKLCQTFEEAKEHFEHLLTVEAVNGGYNTEVLCQEFLRGKEYVVDCVSRNGVHKVMMVWVYDKRPRNGVSYLPCDWAEILLSRIKLLLLAIHRGCYVESLLENIAKHNDGGLTISTQPRPDCSIQVVIGDPSWLLRRARTGKHRQTQ